LFDLIAAKVQELAGRRIGVEIAALVIRNEDRLRRVLK
jgi:hypothetical protein